MISIRSRAVSWILTLTMVFTTVFGSTGMAFAGASDSVVAKIGDTGYETLEAALDEAGKKNGDVTVEIYDKVTLNQNLTGSYDSIKFVGVDTDAEIYLDVQGYITATGKKVAFKDLTLSKSEGGFIANAGFMNVAFGVYDVKEVAYENCMFANGAYASSGKVTFTECTFKRSYEKYGLWAYGNVDATVDSCIFDDYRGIKMYAEGAAKTVDLTVKKTDFSEVKDKPAIVLTYGESVTLENNKYSDTGVFELDLDGAPNGTAVTSDVAPTCKNDNGACGVLVDGKIYTTVEQAEDVATEGSTVTLLHNSTETVEFAAGVTLDKNGFAADGVTVKSPVAKLGDKEYMSLQEAIDEAEKNDEITEIVIDLIADATLDIDAWQTLAIGGDTTKSITINGNGNTLTFNKKNSDWNHIATNNNAKLILNNMTIADTGCNDGPWNRYDINFACDVELNNVTTKALAFKAGAKLNNVKIIDKNTSDTYAIWIQPNGQSVSLNNCTIDMLAATDGRGIKIDEQYVGTPAKVKLNVSETVFKTEEKAAILVKSVAGADIALDGVDITNVAADKVNAVWVDEASASNFNKVTVTGGTVAQEDSEKFEAAIAKDGKVICYYAKLKDAFDAVKAGEEVVIQKAGTYALGTSGKDITITGAVDGVVFDNIGAKNMGSANVTFNNVTFDYYPNVNYTGLQHSGNLVYNDCTIDGQVFLYGKSETFNRCTFNQNSADAYNVWTYGAKEVEFKDCTFNSAGKSVLIYKERSDDFVADVNVIESEFKASTPVDGKAAIEMDSSLIAGINLTIDEATTATGFGEGNVSGNSLWNNKKGNKGDNNDITVKVGENIVLAPTDAKIVLTTKDATVAGPEGMDVESGVEDYVVKYKDGVYFLEHDHDYAWSYVEEIDFTNPEAIAEGMYHQKACECGAIDEASKAMHTFEVKVVKEPTKEDPNGEAKLFCKECGYEETKSFKEIAEITTYLVTEYYDDAYAYAYDYAEKEGYIADAAEGIDTAIEAMEAVRAEVETVESDMTDAFRAETLAEIDEIIETLAAAKTLILKADELDQEALDELMALLTQAGEAMDQLGDTLAQAGIDVYELAVIPALKDAHKILINEIIPQIEKQLQKAIELGTAWLMEKLGDLYDAFIAALPEIDKALYDWFYNNPEKVIGFFMEYGDEFGYLFEKYGDELACVLGYVLATYGPDALEYALENPEETIEKWVEWYNKHGVRALAMIDKYIKTLDEMGVFDELKDAAAQLEEYVIAYAEKVVAELQAMIDELSDEAKAALEDLKAAIEDADVDAIMAALEELYEQGVAIYESATNGYYAATDESYYVALGDTNVEYAQIVADELDLEKDQFVSAGIEGMTAAELKALLESGDEDLTAEIEKADLITLGFSKNTIVQFAKDKLAAVVAGETVDMDWAPYVGKDGAAAMDKAIAEIEAELVAAGVEAAAIDMVVTAIESYAFACTEFACNYPEAVDMIKAINPEAQVVIVGMYNPFENAVLEVEGTTVPVGEFVGALVDLANVHHLAYAMLTGNAIYVAAPDVETKAPFEAAMDIEGFAAAMTDLKALEPSEAGHEYIAQQILDAMNVVSKAVYDAQKLIDKIKGFSDVTVDTLADAKELAEAARAAWDKLTEAEKELIGLENYKVLVEFELAVAETELKVAEDIEKAKEELAEKELALTEIERALAITETKVAKTSVKVVNKSQVKVTWTKAEVTPDKYMVQLYQNGKRVLTKYVEGDVNTYTFKNLFRGAEYSARVTPTVTYDGVSYKGHFRASGTLKSALSKATLGIYKSGKNYQIKSGDQNSTGFQIYISKDKKFKKNVTKIKVVTGKKGLAKTVKATKFAKGKNYVKVRAYTTRNGKTTYGAWSNIGTVTKK